MGSNLISANNIQTFNGIAGSAITAGDLVVNSEAGVLFTASTALTMAQNNNTTNGPSAISAYASIGLSGTYGNTSQIATSVCCQLGNGNIVALYNGDGSTGTSYLNVYTRNIQGAGVINPFIIYETSISFFRVRKINSTSYVVAWASSSTVRFAIYANDGTVILSPTTVATGSISEQNQFNVGCLANGNIVFAWYNGSSGLSYSIYDSTGTPVLAATVAEAGSAPRNIIVVPQSNGGFYIYYNNTSGSNYKFGRYNSTGTLQGSITTVRSSVSNSFAGCVDDNIAIELSNGNVAFCAPNGSGYPYYYVYSSTGASVASALDVSGASSAYSYPGIIPGMCATPSGFAVVTPANSSYRYFNLFDTSGNFVIQKKQTTISTLVANQSASNAYIRVFSNGNAGLTVHDQPYYVSGCSYYWRNYLYSFGNDGVQRGSTVLLQSDTSQAITNNFGILLSDGSVVVTNRWPPGSQSTYWGSYAVMRKSVLGVAQNTVAANGTAIVYPQGNYTINQNMSFGGAFDNRTATVPGTKGTVVGTYAVLQGIS